MFARSLFIAGPKITVSAVDVSLTEGDIGSTRSLNPNWFNYGVYQDMLPDSGPAYAFSWHKRTGWASVSLSREILYVEVYGDENVEPDEYFWWEITDVEGPAAMPSGDAAWGKATIVNDDFNPPPPPGGVRSGRNRELCERGTPAVAGNRRERWFVPAC